MSLILRKKKNFTYKWPEKDPSFSVTFNHPFAEDEDNTFIHKMLADLEPDLDEDEKTRQITELMEGTSTNQYYSKLRKALVSWTDIVDEAGKPLPFNEENQKVVFEHVQSITKLMEKIAADKKEGLSAKN